MNDTLLDKGQKPIAYFGQDFDGLLLVEDFPRFILEVMLKVAITKFLNDVVIVWALHDIVKFNNILRFDSLHDFDLRYEGCF